VVATAELLTRSTRVATTSGMTIMPGTKSSVKSAARRIPCHSKPSCRASRKLAIPTNCEGSPRALVVEAGSRNRKSVNAYQATSTTGHNCQSPKKITAGSRNAQFPNASVKRRP
jgi:hypothetical protein